MSDNFCNYTPPRRSVKFTIDYESSALLLAETLITRSVRVTPAAEELST